jgi:hypothetical protein
MVVLTAFPVAAAPTSGSCGENLTWTLENGVLTISGTGEMTSAPWKDYAKDITKVVIEEGVTSVADNAFSGCSALTTVTFPATLKSLGDYAFYNCTALKKIYFLGDVPSVKNFTFKGVNASVFYPLGNETWSKHALGYTGGALLQQPNFGDKNVCGDNLTWNFADGVLTISGTGEMYDAGDYDLWADHRSDIQKVVIESGVTSISHWAFTYCTALTEVTIPETVVSIHSTAFSMCTSLKKIIIPDSVQAIDGACFDMCSALEEVHIGSGVAQIEGSIFEGCTNLKSLYFYGDAPRVFMSTLTNMAITAYYPAGNESWTEEVRAEYGDNITWVPFCGKNHQEVTLAGKDATCTEEGLTEGKQCSVCSEVTLKQEKIPATGHSYGDWATIKDATEQEEGLQERTCTGCGNKEQQKLDKLPPKETEAPTVPPPTPPTEAPTTPPTETPTETPTEPTVTEPPVSQPPATEPPATTPEQPKPEESGDSLWVLWTCLAVVAIAAVAVVILKRKK